MTNYNIHDAYNQTTKTNTVSNAVSARCDRCKYCSWNRPIEDCNPNIQCYRLLNKDDLDDINKNYNCKYYEEYIGYSGTCSACNNLKAILAKGKEEGEYNIIYTCTIRGKQTQLLSDECKNYVDINFMNKEEEQ